MYTRVVRLNSIQGGWARINKNTKRRRSRVVQRVTHLHINMTTWDVTETPEIVELRSKLAGGGGV